MKILSNSLNRNNGSQQTNNKQTFGMYFKLPEDVIQKAEEYANHTHFNRETTKKFLIKLMEDLIAHNKNAKNHAVYDEVREITDIKIWDGYYQVGIKNNEPVHCYEFNFSINDSSGIYKTMGTKNANCVAGKKSNKIDNFGDFFQLKLIEDKYSKLNPGADSNFKKLVSMVANIVPNKSK